MKFLNDKEILETGEILCKFKTMVRIIIYIILTKKVVKATTSGKSVKKVFNENALNGARRSPFGTRKHPN